MPDFVWYARSAVVAAAALEAFAEWLTPPPLAPGASRCPTSAGSSWGRAVVYFPARAFASRWSG